jgi:hypothetical protein
MTKRQLTVIIGSIIILTQIVMFWDYVSPFTYNQIEVESMMCTCPDAKVIKGEKYLKTITPDSLKRYNLIYSEIYFENRKTTQYDYMGAKKYIVKGEIIGKRNISEGSINYYPLFRKDVYQEKFLFNIFSWGLRGLVIIEFLVLIVLIKRKRNDA